MKRSLTLFLAGLGAAVFTVGLTTSASAHGTNIDRSWGQAGVYGSPHRIAWVCDERADGNGVYNDYVAYSYSTGQYYRDSVRDSNGSSPGCSDETEDRIVNYRLCMDDWGSDTCTAWKGDL